MLHLFNILDILSVEKSIKTLKTPKIPTITETRELIDKAMEVKTAKEREFDNKIMGWHRDNIKTVSEYIMNDAKKGYTETTIFLANLKMPAHTFWKKECIKLILLLKEEVEKAGHSVVFIEDSKEILFTKSTKNLKTYNTKMKINIYRKGTVC